MNASLPPSDRGRVSDLREIALVLCHEAFQSSQCRGWVRYSNEEPNDKGYYRMFQSSQNRGWVSNRNDPFRRNPRSIVSVLSKSRKSSRLACLKIRMEGSGMFQSSQNRGWVRDTPSLAWLAGELALFQSSQNRGRVGDRLTASTIRKRRPRRFSPLNVEEGFASRLAIHKKHSGRERCMQRANRSGANTAKDARGPSRCYGLARS